MKLTKRACDQASYPEEKGSKGFHAIWDGEMKGFGLRVNPTGKKVFILRYRVNGIQGIHSIGEYGKLTVDQARAIAKERFADIGKGIDPNDAKKKTAMGTTIADLATLYLEYSKKTKKSWKNDEYKMNKHVIPSLGNRKIDTIQQKDIQALHSDIGKDAPYEANRVRSLISAMFSYAQKIGMVDGQYSNPCTHVEKFKEQSRDRWVTHEEMPRLWQAIENEANPYIRAALKIDLLTGLRKTELLSLQWKDISFERATVYLGTTKNGRPFTQPLCPLVIEILQSLPRLEGNPHCFPSSVKPGCHIVEIKNSWNRIRKEADLLDIHLHDLRRTVGSWMATAGHSLLLIGKTLNQSSQQVTEVYSRLSTDPVRAALDEHEQNIIQFATIKPVKEKTA